MKISDLYNRKGFFFILSLFLVWIFISSYWYVCGVKGFCKQRIAYNDQSKYVIIQDYEDNEEMDNNEGTIEDGLVVQEQVVQKSITCSPYIKTFLGAKYKNNRNEVAKLQKFLNENEGFDLEVDGYYGPKTTQAVKDFQNKYKDEILKIGDFNLGLVEQETRLQINKIFCKNKAEEVL